MTGMNFFKKTNLLLEIVCDNMYGVLPPGKLVSCVSRLFVLGHIHIGSSCTQLTLLSDPLRG